MYATLALLAPYLQTLMNYPVLTAGVVLAPRGAGLMVAALICGRVIGKVSARLLVGSRLHHRRLCAARDDVVDPGHLGMDVVTVGFVQGLSIGFLAIPINIIAFATLPSAIRTEATSIYSLMRNLGSAIGISITGALLQINTQVNHAHHRRGCEPVQSRPGGGSRRAVVEPGVDARRGYARTRK